MSKQIIISIFLNLFAYSNSKYLREETNYSKPKLERNNVLNKGLWIKDKAEKSNYGDFIFRADSADVDNLLQNNFDAFGDTFKDTVPIFSSYIERNKRSAIHKRNQRIRKSLKKCKEKMNCLNDETEDVKSKFLSKLQPASVFNDYPYEVALLLTNSNKRETRKTNSTTEKLEETSKVDKENDLNNQLNEQNKTDLNPLNKEEKTTNKTMVNIPKRSNAGLESETTKLELVDSVNDTQHIDGNKILRNVFEEEDRIWQNAPIQNIAYNIPRPDKIVKNKPVTEKGLVKVISLLTKTFRKVMKQHSEIQEIDSKLHSLNEDFMKNVAILSNKFHNFDTKYANIVKLEEQLRFLNDKFIKNTELLERRETEMSKNFIEFENQQKKFLAQQRQFYTIQKLMLEQNEKINYKQNLIAKTQSEISHRQNNFARVLKKAKQLYVDTKFSNRSKLGPFFTKPKDNSTKKLKVSENVVLTTTTPTTTEMMKISLFSIPSIAPLINQDKLILNDKEDHLVDDLVFKYYFNNTFIANIMKSKVLTAIMNTEGKETRNAKNKRDKQIKLDTTILLPVINQKEESSKKLNRERRWIRHTKRVPKKFNGKPELRRRIEKAVTEDAKVKQNVEEKTDPFLQMATNFCIEIKQNLNTQMLNWCIEKSLRRLKSIDMKIPMKHVVEFPVIKTVPVRKETIHTKKEAGISSTPKTTELVASESTLATDQPLPSSSPESVTDSTGINTEKAPIFFPDNDELESNLKEFDLTPDQEGTVFFDGSLHTSDIVVSESDALSDIMPGLDSNSHVDVDPLALDLQARRRAYVRRLNADIMRKMKTF